MVVETDDVEVYCEGALMNVMTSGTSDRSGPALTELEPQRLELPD